MEQNNFLAVPYWILKEKDISNCDMLVYSLILSYNSQGQNFFIPADKIGDYIGKTGRATQNSIKKLLELEYIKEDSSKHYKSKCYKINYEKTSYEETSYQYEETSEEYEVISHEYEETSIKDTKLLPNEYEVISPNKNIYNNINNNKDKNIDNNKTICVEPFSKQLILKDNSYFDVTVEQIEKYTAVYKKVDIEKELDKMQLWLESNPRKRKTRRGCATFINSWLSRADTNASTPKQMYNPKPSGTEATDNLIKLMKEKYCDGNENGTILGDSGSSQRRISGT